MKTSIRCDGTGYVVSEDSPLQPTGRQIIGIAAAMLLSISGTLPATNGIHVPTAIYSEINSQGITNRDIAYNGSITYSGSVSMYDSVNLKGIMKLESFLNLSAGWNGYGALPFLPEYIRKAANILADIPNKGEVFPLADGRVQFEFDKADGSYLELEINADDSVNVYGIRSDKTEYESTVKTEEVVRIVTDFYG